MGPRNESMIKKPSTGDRRNRVSFSAWEEDVQGGYSHDEEQQQLKNDTVEQIDEEHEDGRRKRRPSFIRENSASTDQVLVDAEMDQIFDEVFTIGATRKSSRASTVSVGFIGDDPYDAEYDEGYEDEHEIFEIVRLKSRKGGEDNLLHPRIPNTVFFCFMVTMFGLLLYSVTLVFDVENNEPSPVIDYIEDHERPVIDYIEGHERHGTTPAPTKAPLFTLEPVPVPSPPPSNNPLWGQIFDEMETIPSDLGMSLPKPDPQTEDDSNVASLPETDPQTGDDSNVAAAVQDPQMIGLVEAPLKLEELELLVKTKYKMTRPRLDTTDHTKVTDEHGNILHCGIKVDNMPVYSECLARQSLCQVYVGSDCEPSDED